MTRHPFTEVSIVEEQMDAFSQELIFIILCLLTDLAAHRVQTEPIRYNSTRHPTTDLFDKLASWLVY